MCQCANRYDWIDKKCTGQQNIIHEQQIAGSTHTHVLNKMPKTSKKSKANNEQKKTVVKKKTDKLSFSSVFNVHTNVMNKKQKVKEAKESTQQLINEVKKEKEMQARVMEENIKFLNDLEDDVDNVESLSKMNKRRKKRR